MTGEETLLSNSFLCLAVQSEGGEQCYFSLCLASAVQLSCSVRQAPCTHLFWYSCVRIL